MDTKPPAEVSLDDIEPPAVAAGSPRIVIVFALILCLILGLVVWGMYQSHRKRVEAAATVPSVMSTQAARPAESNRESTERLNPPPTKKVTVAIPPSPNPPTPESTSSPGGPVIRFEPNALAGTTASGGSMPGSSPGLAPAEDPEAQEQKLILDARKAALAVPFGSGTPNASTASLPAVPPPPGTPSPETTMMDSLRTAYASALHPPESASTVNKQSAFTRSEDSAVLGRSVPLPPFSLIKGTPIPAIVDKNTSSQLPGQIEAHVAEDVYNSLCGQMHYGCFVVIPAGSRLIGEYNAEVAYGQDRLQVAWTKLYFPDTSSIDLGRMAGYSGDGVAGLKGTVDNHWKRIIGGVLLTTTLNVGFAVSQSRNQSAGYYPSPGQAAAAGVGTSLTQFGEELTRRNAQIPPYVKIAVGTPITIDTNRDMIFDGPYRPLR